MRREKLDAEITTINMDRKVMEFLDKMAVEAQTSRSSVANYLLKQSIKEIAVLKKQYPKFSDPDLLQWMGDLNHMELTGKTVTKRKPRIA